MSNKTTKYRNKSTNKIWIATKQGDGKICFKREGSGDQSKTLDKATFDRITCGVDTIFEIISIDYAQNKESK
jgi:hypothetical protein